MTTEFSPKEDVYRILEDSLTQKGFEQWWSARNRYLAGARPCDVSVEHATEAAYAFRDGVYL